MNGRVYDPQLGRFLSADKFVQFPANLQSYNRYSYVHNNPLTHTDSTGELIDTIWDVGSAIVGVIEVGANLYAGDWGEAAVAAGGVAIDVGAAFVPFVPGGASVAIKAGREGAELVAKEALSEGAEKIAKEATEKAAKEAPALKQVDSVDVDVKLDTAVDPKVAPPDEVAKGGTYKLRDPETGEVKRTGRTKDHERRSAEHGKKGSETEGLEYEVDTRTDDYAEQRGREQVIHDQHPEARHKDHVEGGTEGGLNKKRAVSPDNPRIDEYKEAAERLRKRLFE
jgi:hypothetical protein